MKSTLLRIPLLLLLSAFWLAAWSPARAAEMMCPEHTSVSIDIKPGSNANPINLNSRGIIPVAVLTTASFDANQFTPEIAYLSDATSAMAAGCAGATAARWTREDVNHDGQDDLLLFFNAHTLNLTANSRAATLMAHGAYAGSVLHIMGTDTVWIRPS